MAGRTLNTAELLVRSVAQMELSHNNITQLNLPSRSPLPISVGAEHYYATRSVSLECQKYIEYCLLFYLLCQH